MAVTSRFARVLTCVGASIALAVPLVPAAASSPCALHGPHSGAHERSTCGLDKLGALEISTEAGIGRIAVRGGIAAVVQREEGQVALLDVRDTAALRVLGRYDGGTGRAELDDPFDGDVAFSSDGRYLFYARQTHNWSNEGLHVLDIADPATPKRVAYNPQGGMLRLAYHRVGEVEYVVTLDAIVGMTVFRFVRTALGGELVPLHVDALPALKVGGPASAGLHIDPKDPKLGIPLLYVSTGRTGIDVYDFSDPGSPKRLGGWAAEGLADFEVAASAEGRTIYAATEYWFSANRLPRIVVLDAGDLGAIAERQRVSPGPIAYPGGASWRVQGLALDGGRLHVAHSHAGYGLLDLGALAGPPLATTTDLGEQNKGGDFPSLSSYAMDVTVADGLIYVTDASTGTLSVFRLQPSEG